MATLADLRVILNLDDKLSGKLKNSAKKLDDLGGSFEKVGGVMSAGFTAPVLAVGAGLLKLGSDADSMNDTIQIGTGATGKALEGLQADALAVFQSIPTSMDLTGQAISELNQRTGQTGKGLQDLATTELELSRITGQDLGEQIAATTRLFGDWGISADQQVPTLNKLFRASQATGVGVDALSASMTKFGGPLRQMGFSFDQTAALLGKFEKEGVNTELVMGSMRIALGKMAAKGINDPAKALEKITSDIKNAGSAGEANALAMEYFGARAGPDMAAAIREGRFDIGKLFDLIGSGKGTITGTASATDDWAEKLQVLRNRAMVKLLPLASQVFDAMSAGMPVFERAVDLTGQLVDGFLKLPKRVKVGIIAFVGLLAILGPVAVAIGAVFGAVATLAPVFAVLIGPIGLVVAALVLLGIAYKKNIFGFGDAVRTVAGAVVRFAKTFISTFQQIHGMGVTPFAAGIATILVLLRKLGGAHPPKLFVVLLDILGSATDAMQGFELRVRAAFKKIGDAIRAGNWRKALAGIGDLLAAPAKAIGEFVDSIQTGFRPLDVVLHNFGRMWVDMGRLIQEVMQGDIAGALAVGERLVKHLALFWINAFLLIPKIALAAFQAIDWGTVGTLLLNGLVLAIQYLGKGALWLLQFGSDMLAGLLQGAADQWPEVADWLGKLSGQVLEALGDASKWLYDKGVDTLSGLIRGIADEWTPLVTFVTSLPNAVIRIFQYADTWLRSAGVNIVMGLWNGIADTWGRMTGWIEDAAGKLPGLINKVTGSHSPARKMMPPGENAANGFWSGYADAWNNNAKKIGSLAATLPNGLRGVFSAGDAMFGRQKGPWGGGILNGWEKLTDGFWRAVNSGMIVKGIRAEDGSFVNPSFYYGTGYTAGTALGQGVADGFTKTLGIASPSRVFMELGKHSAQGFQIGYARAMATPTPLAATATAAGRVAAGGGGRTVIIHGGVHAHVSGAGLNEQQLSDRVSRRILRAINRDDAQYAGGVG